MTPPHSPGANDASTPVKDSKLTIDTSGFHPRTANGGGEEELDELTPDSMSSRLKDSSIAGLDATIAGDLVFDRMGSRIDEV